MKAPVLACCLAGLTLQAQPVPHRFTLPNGLRVVHLEDHERPLVRALLHLGIDPADVPAGHQGLAQLAVRMVDQSNAGNLRPEELQRLMEGAGIQWSWSLVPGGLEWRVLARSRDQDRALGLLADRLLRTILDPQLLEAQRLSCWQEEELRQAAAADPLQAALRPAPQLRPTSAGLGAINFEDLLGFREKVFRPDRAVLILQGDLGLEQAKRLVLLNLGSWSNTPPSATPDAPPAVPPPAPRRGGLRFPAGGTGLKVQAMAPGPDLRPETRALLALLVPGDPALAPVQVTVDGPALTAALLAQQGLPGAATWALLHDRLEALRKRGFSQDDLERARAAWLAGRSLDLLHPDAQLEAALADATGSGVSADRIQALSLETLNAGLRLWLDPANLQSGAMGDPDSLKALPAP